MNKEKYLMRLGVAILVVTLFVSFAVKATEDEAIDLEMSEVKADVQPTDLPDIIMRAIKIEFPNGKITGIRKELAGARLVQYDAVIRSEENVFDVEISPAGKIIEIKKRRVATAASMNKPDQQWTKSFDIENRTFSSTGRNPYFILEPGHQRVFKTDTPGDKLIITVLKDTKVVNGIKTRVVEEREWLAGELVEVSRNFFAICNRTNDVFYFGEEVDDYENDKIVSHGGAWLAGENGAVAGILVPGTFLLGARYYQEIAEGVAMDRSENMAMELTINAPAGIFNHCVKTIETTPLEPGTESVKIYCPGIGLIVDDAFKLVEVKG